MAWKEICYMDERLAFISDWLRGELPMTVLCESYAISRKTGYKWTARYRDEGAGGLHDRSRAPHCHGRRMAANWPGRPERLANRSRFQTFPRKGYAARPMESYIQPALQHSPNRQSKKGSCPLINSGE